MGEEAKEPYSEYGDESTGTHNDEARSFYASPFIHGGSG